MVVANILILNFIISPSKELIIQTISSNYLDYTKVGSQSFGVNSKEFLIVQNLLWRSTLTDQPLLQVGVTPRAVISDGIELDL